jgi:hypothetical protein
MGIYAKLDEEFAELCSWLKANKLEAKTSRGQTLIVRPKTFVKPKLEVRNGRLVRK